MPATRDYRTPNPGHVVVDPGKGEHLRFSLRVSGPKPIFAFASSHSAHALHEASDFDSSATEFEWFRLKKLSDVQQMETLLLKVAFISNERYDYKVDLRSSSGASVKTVLDVTLTAPPTVTDAESFVVIIQEEAIQ